MRERVILEECLWARQREMLRVVSGIGKNNHLSFEERECNIITPCYISVPFRSSRRLNNNLPVLLRLTPIWRHFKVKYVILETTLQTQTVALVLPSAIGTPVLQDVGGRQPPITLESTYWVWPQPYKWKHYIWQAQLLRDTERARGGLLLHLRVNVSNRCSQLLKSPVIYDLHSKHCITNLLCLKVSY